jgi:AraC-like DNA-binding protein
MFRLRPPLANHIEYVGYWDGHCDPGSSTPRHVSRALPRGAATVIIGLGDTTDVGFYSSDGRTALTVPPAFIVGAGVSSHVIRMESAQTVMTVHFRPAGALPFVGHPLGELENTWIGLEDLWGRDAEVLCERLFATTSAGRRVAMLEAFLLDRMRRVDLRLNPGVASVVESAEREPSMHVAQVAGAVGLPRKRFNAVFRSEVGLTPKAYFRVRRLQAALRGLGASRPGAEIAADLGYFDQAHFVREFRSFTGMTPTQYLQRRSRMPGHVDLDQNIQATLTWVRR